MTTLFFIIMALAFVHFIYEGIIAPSIRFKLRLDLFKLRDDLRELKMEEDCELCDEGFIHLQDRLNNTLRHLSHIDLRLLAIAHQKLDKERSAELEALDKIIDECPMSEVQDISHRQLDHIGKALFTNNGGLLLYLVPLALLMAFYSSLIRYAKRILSLPENDVDRLIPPDGLARA